MKKLFPFARIAENLYEVSIHLNLFVGNKILSQRTTKLTIRTVWPANTQISLYILFSMASVLNYTSLDSPEDVQADLSSLVVQVVL